MRPVIAGLLLVCCTGAALAQAPAGADLEPAVNTSAPAPALVPPVTPSAKSPAPAAKPSVAAPPAAAQGAARPAAKPAAAAAKGGRSLDRLELEATQITGNRELPKVMYVVPWRRADLGDLLGRPANSLLDEALTPVDRDVFRRQTQYYEALQPDQAGAAPAPGKDER
jgi:hypothetical protein